MTFTTLIKAHRGVLDPLGTIFGGFLDRDFKSGSSTLTPEGNGAADNDDIVGAESGGLDAEATM